MENLLDTPGSDDNWDEKYEEKYLEWEKRMDAAMMKKALAKLDGMDDISGDPLDPDNSPEAGHRNTIRKSGPYQYAKRDLNDYNFERDWLGTTFIRVPTPVLKDRRLSHTDIAVLMALASFANNYYGTCMPSREELAKRVGISIHNISRATTRLNDYGWLTKKQKNRNSPVYYHLHIPPQFVIDEDLRRRPAPANPPEMPDVDIWRDDY